jgi:adenine phosphoribosyltransferase
VITGDARRDSGVTSGGSDPQLALRVASRVVDVPDFPKPGILFKDVTPVFADGAVFAAVVDSMVAHHRTAGFDVVAGVEARGFILAAALAYASGVGVVAVRKAGKLPREVVSAAYDLEYGQATVEVQADAFLPGQRVLVVDDVLATGGTLAAALDLVRLAGGRVAGCGVLLELASLGGRARLAPTLGGLPVHALLTV